MAPTECAVLSPLPLKRTLTLLIHPERSSFLVGDSDVASHHTVTGRDAHLFGGSESIGHDIQELP